ncbi:uncharacterized protein RAG0_10102 [Rhynchosporium agropyri]|uniref:Uncharacterized protein n=2 Tax=Rhynchosporium TaxID=38037 RepID=A0A1E1KYH0_9HELO|nr:uncharacterized protein RCO7_14503 [Rhynchosporium commune]CZT03302.1 uncharacterized protein RAG0_10102 [Rhynchosporium agropyri]
MHALLRTPPPSIEMQGTITTRLGGFMQNPVPCKTKNVLKGSGLKPPGHPRLFVGRSQ